MRRIKLIFAVAAAIALMVTASVAPAMAHDNDNNDFHFHNNNLHFNHNNDFNDDDIFFVSPCYFDGFDHSCPFWGDLEGPVNHFDCFDD
jgi:hypothetical protein